MSDGHAIDMVSDASAPGGMAFRATGAGTLTRSLPEARAFRVWADVRLGTPGAPIVLRIGTAGAAATIAAASIAGDDADDALIRAVAWDTSPESPRGSAEYRLRPDISRWGLPEATLHDLRREFAAIPGWRDRWVRLALDVAAHEVHAWVDGRLVATWTRSAASLAGQVELVLSPGGGCLCADGGDLSLPDDDAFLPVDLASYYNHASTAGGRAAFMRRIESEGVPFVLNTSPGELDAVDLGRTTYRGRMAFIETYAFSSDPGRVLLRAPKRMYDRAHLLCSLGDAPGTVPTAAVRYIKGGRGHSVVSEFSLRAPDVRPLPGTNLVHVTVPLDPGAFHEFLADPAEEAVELDLTRRVARDENLYPAPAGPPSAVHVHAITLEAAPVAMALTSDRIGHIFEAPDQPRFAVRLVSARDVPQDVRLVAEITGPYGERAAHVEDVSLAPREERTVTLDLPQRVNGKFDLAVTLSAPADGRTLVRRTSFALLPPDTRRAVDESPFGIWAFFEGHFGLSPETAGPLFRLAGARWTLANFLVRSDPKETMARVAALAPYKVGVSAANVACIANTCNAAPGDVDGMIERMRTMPVPKYWLIFWETALSDGHARAFPPELVGGRPLVLDEAEERVLRNCWDTALPYARHVRRGFPGAKLVYGNGFPNFLGALMERKFPKELIDGFGLDFDMFVASPELQPRPLHAPFPALYHLKRFQDIYGYGDVPRYLTEAIYCPEAPLWLSERQQADHYARTHLLAMASGVVHFGMTAELWDPGSYFFYSHYGPVGLCHRPPELNPRESFCAYATMTRMLDRATFDAMLPTGSPTVFALRFRRPREVGGPVHALWTVRGERTASFRVPRARSVRVTDLFGNARPVTPRGGRYVVTLTSSPLYVEGAPEIADLVLGEPHHRPGPTVETTIVRAGSLDTWEEVPGPDAWVESSPPGLVPAPIARGRFSLATVEDVVPGPSGPSSAQVLRIRLDDDQPAHPLHVFYTVLRLARAAAIGGRAVDVDGRPRALGAWLRGNSGWGRVIYDLRDSQGVRWRSRNETSYVDFDGWRYVQTLLPWPADDEHLEPTGMSQWKPDREGAVPAYPMTLEAVVVEARSHVIRAVSLDAVPDRSIDLARIVVTDEMVEPETRLH